MKIFRFEELMRIAGPDPALPFRPEVLTGEQGARALGGMFGLLPPGTSVPYHYHRNRESVLIALSGEAVEVVEGRETAVRAGDVLFIPSGEKHLTANRSEAEFRFIEFFTCPPLKEDFVAVDEKR